MRYSMSDWFWIRIAIRNLIQDYQSEKGTAWDDGDLRQKLREMYILEEKIESQYHKYLNKLKKANSTPASASSASPALSQGLKADNERGQGNA